MSSGRGTRAMPSSEMHSSPALPHAAMSREACSATDRSARSPDSPLTCSATAFAATMNISPLPGSPRWHTRPCPPPGKHRRFCPAPERRYGPRIPPAETGYRSRKSLARRTSDTLRGLCIPSARLTSNKEKRSLTEQCADATHMPKPELRKPHEIFPIAR